MTKDRGRERGREGGRQSVCVRVRAHVCAFPCVRSWPMEPTNLGVLWRNLANAAQQPVFCRCKKSLAAASVRVARPHTLHAADALALAARRCLLVVRGLAVQRCRLVAGPDGGVCAAYCIHGWRLGSGLDGARAPRTTVTTVCSGCRVSCAFEDVENSTLVQLCAAAVIGAAQTARVSRLARGVRQEPQHRRHRRRGAVGVSLLGVHHSLPCQGSGLRLLGLKCTQRLARPGPVSTWRSLVPKRTGARPWTRHEWAGEDCQLSRDEGRIVFLSRLCPPKAPPQAGQDEGARRRAERAAEGHHQ